MINLDSCTPEQMALINETKAILHELKQFTEHSRATRSIDSSMLSSLNDIYICAMLDIPKNESNRELIDATLINGMKSVIHLFENVDHWAEQQYKRAIGELDYPIGWEPMETKFFDRIKYWKEAYAKMEPTVTTGKEAIIDQIKTYREVAFNGLDKNAEQTQLLKTFYDRGTAAALDAVETWSTVTAVVITKAEDGTESDDLVQLTDLSKAFWADVNN